MRDPFAALSVEAFLALAFAAHSEWPMAVGSACLMALECVSYAESLRRSP